MKRLLLILIFVSLSFEISNAYENVGAHRRINEAVVEKFLAKASTYDRFKNYSFMLNSVTFKGPAVVASGYFDITTANKDFTIKDWIIEGGYSADEPEAPAALRHFYDPLANNQGKYYLTDLNVDIANPAVDAIFWHFDGYDPQSIVYEWSWNKGKEYMAKALEANDENQRNTWIAKAFRSLGEVLHNTADMGCPPHVRNDAHGGFPGVGGSDPYESGFNPDWAEQFAGNNPDPSLASYFTSATKAININKKLAEFTNKYFFTNETIYGKGVASYKSRNKMPDYPSPLLENLEYEDDSFNYYYTFPSGRKIELCNDRSLFLGYISQNFRAYPRVTQKNVESQAQELVPNIISAGVNVVRNFIPQIEFVVNTNAKDKKVFGEVRTAKNDEYQNIIKYGGKVKFRINGVNSDVEAMCNNGIFDATVPNIKAGDKVIAYIVFADMIVKSNEFVVEDNIPSNIVTLGNYTMSLYPDAVSTADYKVEHFGNTMKFTKKNGNYTYTAEVSWLNPPSGDFVVEDGKVFMNQVLSFKFTETALTGGPTFPGCEIYIRPVEGGYVDFEASQAWEETFGFKYFDDITKKLPTENGVNTANTTIEIPVVIERIGNWNGPDNKEDGEIIFSGAIRKFWGGSWGGDDVIFEIKYEYKD